MFFGIFLGIFFVRYKALLTQWISRSDQQQNRDVKMSRFYHVKGFLPRRRVNFSIPSFYRDVSFLTHTSTLIVLHSTFWDVQGLSHCDNWCNMSHRSLDLCCHTKQRLCTGLCLFVLGTTSLRTKALQRRVKFHTSINHDRKLRLSKRRQGVSARLLNQLDESKTGTHSLLKTVI